MPRLEFLCKLHRRWSLRSPDDFAEMNGQWLCSPFATHCRSTAFTGFLTTKQREGRGTNSGTNLHCCRIQKMRDVRMDFSSCPQTPCAVSGVCSKALHGHRRLFLCCALQDQNCRLQLPQETSARASATTADVADFTDHLHLIPGCLKQTVLMEQSRRQQRKHTPHRLKQVISK